MGQRQWKTMESSLWSAQPEMNPRLQPLLVSAISRNLKDMWPLPIRMLHVPPFNFSAPTCSSRQCRKPLPRCRQRDRAVSHWRCAGSAGPLLSNQNQNRKISINPCQRLTGSRSKPSATSNSNNPVAGEKTQTMEMAALFVFFWFIF